MLIILTHCLFYDDISSNKIELSCIRVTSAIHTYTIDYVKNNGNASDKAMNAIQPPIVIIMVFFTSWSPFCILK